MTVIKRLDRYILQKFLLIFVGAFFICLFVFMMQFTWRYVDDLIGKGLSMDVLAQFFWYMGLTLVPQAMPLAVLLASLITFGNMGESLELLSIKAAGVSLARTMRPVGLFALLMAGVSFYFQNSTSPHAQISLRTLIFSMRQQSPAVEIPEGVFYNGVPDINLFVQKKDAATGMLYQTIIYKTDQGFDRAQIVLADSARLEMTADKMHLKLYLWNGELFESLQGSGAAGISQSGAEQPYDRETFIYKQLLIDFDSNFNLMDKDLLSGMASAKNMHQIVHSVDSMEQEQDSIGRLIYEEESRRHFVRAALSRADSLGLAAALRKAGGKTDFDALVQGQPAGRVQQAMQQMRQTVQGVKSDLEWRGMGVAETDHRIRSHWVEWHQKMTFSLACLVFFFVGAPLGAIIRKGGLGMPTVISVIIFIIWYIINTSGMKMARDGNLNMAFGMWVSLLVIAPFGFWITYKANRDSVVFNLDAYLGLLRRLLGLRPKRHVMMKEVVIEDPRLDAMPQLIGQLRDDCRRYNAQHHLLRAPGYASTFFRYRPDTQVADISRQMEALVEELSNSRNPKLLAMLGEFPFLYTRAHTSPFHSRRLNVAAGIFFPVGLVLWLRIWRFRLWLLRDLRTIVRTCDRLENILRGGSAEEGGSLAAQDGKEGRRKRNLLRRIAKWAVIALAAALLARVAWTGWKNYGHRRTPTEQAQPQTAPLILKKK